MKRDDPRHGTYAGAQTHQRDGEKACDLCRDAYNAYHREHRKTNTRWLEQGRARDRAVWRLVDLHREEFDRLYVEERTADHVKRMSESA